MGWAGWAVRGGGGECSDVRLGGAGKGTPWPPPECSARYRQPTIAARCSGWGECTTPCWAPAVASAVQTLRCRPLAAWARLCSVSACWRMRGFFLRQPSPWLGCVCAACRHCLSMKRDRMIERLEWMIVIILSLEVGISLVKILLNVPH